MDTLTGFSIAQVKHISRALCNVCMMKISVQNSLAERVQVEQSTQRLRSMAKHAVKENSSFGISEKTKINRFVSSQSETCLEFRVLLAIGMEAVVIPTSFRR